MAGDDSETYECECAGHTDGSRSFEAAPKAWFDAMGFDSYPKNCPACKSWQAAQVDEIVRCSSCGRNMRQSAKFKKWFQKREGVYKPPESCASCEREGGPPARPAKFRRPSFLDKQVEEFRRLGPLKGYGPPTAISILDLPDGYQHPVPIRRELGSGKETRQLHIEAHMPGTEQFHSTGYVKSGAGSLTTLGGGTAHFGSYLRDAARLSREIDPEWVLEKLDRGKIVKIDIETGDKLILEAAPSQPLRYRVVSSYIVSPRKL
jgi:hypothetical protein